ncbi:MAG: Trp repressor binding protein, partial [uncultured Thermoleophilia bacterium]
DSRRHRLLLVHRHEPGHRRGGRRGRPLRRRRGPRPQGRGDRPRRRHRREPRLACLRRRHEGRPAADPRRPPVGGRDRVRLADPVRQRGRAAEGVHGHDRAAVGPGPARGQGLLGVHLGPERARGSGGDPARPLQHDLPLRRHHRPAGLHRPVDLRVGGQPLRRLGDRRRPRRPRPGGSRPRALPRPPRRRGRRPRRPCGRHRL